MRFLSPTQTLEMHPADAERLKVAQGQRVAVSSNGHSLTATVSLRERMLEGSAFLIEGTREEGANRLAGATVVDVAPAPEEPPPPETNGDAPSSPTLKVEKREPVGWG